MKLNTDQINAVDLLYKTYGRTEITRSEINDLVKQGKLKNPSWLKSDQYKVKYFDTFIYSILNIVCGETIFELPRK